MEKIKVALIGYGHLGRWHAQKVEALPESSLFAIVESDVTKHKVIGEQYPHVKMVASLEEVIAEIDAAIIVSPTSTHYSYIEMLLAHNKHILSEKPLCASMEEVALLENLLKQKGEHSLVLQCGHSERFHAVWEWGLLQKALETSSDTPFVIECKRVMPFAGRACDVDVVQDLMIHDIDLLYYLFKQTPVTISAKGLRLRTNHWDSVWAEFTYANGSRAYLETNRDDVKTIRGLNMTTPDLTCSVNLFANEVSWLNRGLAGESVQKQTYEKRDHLLLEQQHFYRSILSGAAPVVSFEDALLACKTAHKVLEALELGTSVTL